MAPSRLALASWLLALPGVYAAIAPFNSLIPDHAFDQSWSPHARFHVTWAAGKLFALGINQIILALIPLRDRQQWSWFALASNLIFGGLIVPVAVRVQIGPLRPLHTHDRATRLQFLGWLSSILGLALAFGPVFRESRSHQQEKC